MTFYLFVIKEYNIVNNVLNEKSNKWEVWNESYGKKVKE